MNLLSRLRLGRPVEARAGMVQLLQTWGGKDETIPTSFVNFVNEGLNASPVIAALVTTRMRLFADVAFRWRDRQTKEWVSEEIEALRDPVLKAQAEVDHSLAGNSYIHTLPDTAQRLRPDWVEVVSDGRQKVGYRYSPDGPSSEKRIVLPLDEVIHYYDTPDPLKAFVGRSWLSAAARDINADVSASKYINAFYSNAATPNMIVKAAGELSESERKEFREIIEERYTGDMNAFRTLILEGGADIEVVGKDLRQLEFSASRAAGETRMAAAAGVAPIVAGLREGLQAGTYSNYGQAVRKTIDWLSRPLWRNFSRAAEIAFPAPSPNAELWYDDSEVAALQQDALDDATIKSKKAGTMATLIAAGFEPTQVAEAVETGNFGAMDHTGLFSVQLQPADEDGVFNAQPNGPTSED